MSPTVFERCGGFAKVRKIVSAYYDKVLDCELVQGHFMNVDMRRLIDHQTKFMASVMGGPASYDDETLRRAHAHLGISRAEFAEMVRLLGETLEEFDLPDADIEEVRSRLLRQEPNIVSRHA